MMLYSLDDAIVKGKFDDYKGYEFWKNQWLSQAMVLLSKAEGGSDGVFEFLADKGIYEFDVYAETDIVSMVSELLLYTKSRMKIRRIVSGSNRKFKHSFDRPFNHTALIVRSTIQLALLRIVTRLRRARRSLCYVHSHTI